MIETRENNTVLHTTLTQDTHKGDEKSLSCKYCNRPFTRIDSLNRHYNYCKSKKETDIELKKVLSEKDDLIKKIKREKDKQISDLKHLVLYFENLLSHTTETLDKTVTAISFANIHYTMNDNPLKSPTNNDLLLLHDNKKYPTKKDKKYFKKSTEQRKKDRDRKIFETSTYEYSGGTKQLAEYITNLIVEIYKKGNPEDQSVWNSDSARLNFIIREVIKNTDKTKWHIDKKGVKVTRIIIDPILKNFKGVLENELQQSCDNMKKLKGFNMRMEGLRIERSSKIIKEIDDGELGKAILKKMAGHFYLNKDILGKEIEP